MGQRAVEMSHRLGLQQLEARDRQLAPEVEQLVLDHDQQLPHVRRQRLGEQHTELRIELVDVAHRLDPKVVLRDARAIAEPRRAVVSGPGRDLRQAVGHAAC